MGQNDNDLVYGWSYLQARNLLLEQDYNRMKWLPNFAKLLVDEHVEFSGMWDDHVERLEFYRERE